MQINELGVRCPVSISPFHSTDRAIALMGEHDIRALLVTDREGLVGLVTDADLLESVGMLLRAERLAIGPSVANEEIIVADVMDAAVPVMAPTDLVTDAAHRMISSKRTALPVVDGSRLLGVVTDEDLLELFAATCHLGDTGPHGEAVMHFGSRVLRTVSPEDTLATACARLSGGRIRHLLVSEGTQYVGMLSDWDIRLAIGQNALGDWLNSRVRDYMVTGVQTLRPRDTLLCAAEVLRIEKMRAAPITSREGELIGIITATDLLRALAWSAAVPI